MLMVTEFARLLGTEPWAMEPARLHTLEHAVRGWQRAAANPTEHELLALRALMGAKPSAPRQANGVGILPIYGFLIQHANPIAELFGATGLDAVTAGFDTLMASPEVGSVVLDFDSPGGSVYGVTELAAHIFEAKGRGTKRVVAVANSLMCSAAYWFGSAADEVVGSPSSETGALGVFTVHIDVSEMDQKEGIKRTVIAAGKHKAEALPGMPLSEEAKAALTERVEEVYDQLVRDVARHRMVTPAAVRGGFGEGRSLGGTRAKEAGLIDRIGTLDEVVAKLLPRPPRPAKGARAEMLDRALALDTSRLDV